MKSTILRLIPLFVFLSLAVFLWRGLSQEPQYLPSAQLGKSLPPFKLEGLNSTMLRGQVSLLNVWASWCGACREEQIFLMQLSREGRVIYGLNYKDNAEDAKHWLNEWGNPYQAIGEDNDGRVAIDLGVYGAPETFLIDKAGVIRYRYAGILNSKVWADDFLPRIKSLEKEA